MLKLTSSLLTKKLKDVGGIFAKHGLDKTDRPVFDFYVTSILKEAITGELPKQILAKQQKNAEKIAGNPHLQALAQEIEAQLPELASRSAKLSA